MQTVAIYIIQQDSPVDLPERLSTVWATKGRIWMQTG